MFSKTMRAGVVSPFDAPASWRHQCRRSEGLRGCGNLSPIHSPHWLRLRHGDHGPLPRRPIFNDGVDGGPALAAGRTLEDGPLAAQQIWKASISAIWQKQNGSRFCKWWPVRKWKKTRKGKTSSQSHFLSLSFTFHSLCLSLSHSAPSMISEGCCPFPYHMCVYISEILNFMCATSFLS